MKQCNSSADNFSSYYESNESVFQTLSEIDPQDYQKYIDWLSVAPLGARLLDVGCGIGVVANKLSAKGYDAYGVDANELSLDVARRGGANFQLVADYRLPFDDGYFDATGSYTVIEHVSNPDLFLKEQVRVLKPGGRLVVACPNFLKIVGLESHHPRTRGVIRKVVNFGGLVKRWALVALGISPGFEMMEPIVRPVFEADDDAIVVTNPIDIGAALRRFGMRITYSSGTLRYFPDRYEKIGSLPLVRSLIGGVFIVAEKTK